MLASANMFCMKNVRGFTLVEMAVVLVIVSAVGGLLLSGINTFVHHTSQATTRARQQEIKSSLIAYLRDHSRLPCPAAQAAPGVESSAPNSELCSTQSGTLPFKALGLPQAETMDAWGNYFTYVVSPAWNKSLDLSKSSEGSVPVDGDPPAVAVVLSHGSNGDGAYNEGSNKNSAPTEDAEKANAESCSPKCYRVGSVDSFDDVLFSISKRELFEPLLSQGWLPKADEVCLEVKRALVSAAVYSPAVPPEPSGQYTVGAGSVKAGCPSVDYTFKLTSNPQVKECGCVFTRGEVWDVFAKTGF